MKDYNKVKGGARNLDTKFKIRLGRHLAFEFRKPKESQSVTELKARIKQLEAKLGLQQLYINALVQGVTYIRDLSGRFYSLFNNGIVVDSEGRHLQMNWDQSNTMDDGRFIEFRKNIDGTLQEWVPNERGELIALA